jgi:hypothetical protein
MTRILVTREDGSVIWNESVNATDFDTTHFRLALADRLGWAVSDADSGVASPSFAAMEEMGQRERSTERSNSSERVFAGAM